MLHILLIGKLFMYLDPGSGSFILQMLIAGFRGLGLGITIFWNRIKIMFGKGKPKQEESEDESDDEDQPK